MNAVTIACGVWSAAASSIGAISSCLAGPTNGALVTFLVSISDLSILNIGSAFWGLLAGLAVSWAVERNDFGDPADDQR